MTIKGKTLIASMMIFALAIGLFAGTLMKGAEKTMAAPTNEDDNRKTVSAQGEGIVHAAPDIAIVSLGVETSKKEMEAAQSSNREIMNDIMEELNKLGIQEQDIQTENYSVYPDYKWENDKRILTGYKVVNMVRVKIREIDHTGKVLDNVAAKGANMVNGIQFTIEETSQLYQEALKLAVKDAENKAKVLTGYFGIGSLTPVTITEKPQGYYPLQYSDGARLMAEAEYSTSISTGQMEIRASVDVTFEY
ncbi:MAG: SIMPL domain-containing protein [Caldicoprobacterales bacterium]|jgi:uncharacterized protein YggE